MIAAGWIVPFTTEHDFILAALYAGVTLGLGLGIVFRFGGTTGGVDIVARILGRKFGWSMGQIILAVDVIIIGASLFYIPREKILYTLVAVFIASRVIDFIQEGAYAAKAFTIISDASPQIADLITAEMDRAYAYPGYRRLFQTSQTYGLLCRIPFGDPPAACWSNRSIPRPSSLSVTYMTCMAKASGRPKACLSD